MDHILFLGFSCCFVFIMVCWSTDIKCIPTFIPIQIIAFSKESFMWKTHYVIRNFLLYLMDRVRSITVVLNESRSYTACLWDISLLNTGPKVIWNMKGPRIRSVTTFNLVWSTGVYVTDTLSGHIILCWKIQNWLKPCGKDMG